MPVLLAIVAALGVYAITLGGSYVYDDVILHEDARFMHPNLWEEFWTQAYMPDAVDRLYRPLTCLTFAIEYSLHGDRPWIYHLVNILLNAAVAGAVAELARRLMGLRIALAAGLLFAVHPVHVEAVAGLVGRAELLCALPTLLALIFFLKPISAGRAIAIWVCLVIAILSKEQGILLPGFLLALVPFRRALMRGTGGLPVSLSDEHERAARPSDATAMRGLAAAICLTMAAYLIFREQLLGFEWNRQELDWTANPLIRSVGVDRWLMPFVLLGRYVSLLIAPLKLSLDYGSYVIGWTVNWRQPWFYLGAMTAFVWIVAIIWTIRWRNYAAVFCLAALALSYGMVSNSVILIGTIFGERLMYLPSAFFCIVAAALLASFCRGAMLPIVVVIITALFTVRTFTYARLWNDPLRLYLADLRDHPMSTHLHGLVVDQYLARGEYRAAREVAADSLRKLPDAFESYRMAVAADLKLHDYADARRVLAHPDRRVPGKKIADLQEAVDAADKR
jgi:hypothetical protein